MGTWRLTLLLVHLITLGTFSCAIEVSIPGVAVQVL